MKRTQMFEKVGATIEVCVSCVLSVGSDSALCLRRASTLQEIEGGKLRFFVCLLGVWLDRVEANPHSACEVPHFFREIEGDNYRHFFDMPWNKEGHSRDLFNVFWGTGKIFVGVHFGVILRSFWMIFETSFVIKKTETTKSRGAHF